MAVLHQATLRPAKLDLLAAWIPHQPWYGHGETTPISLTMLGAYRFDDPAGEVGIETHLLRAGTTVLQVPVTYRAAPLPGAEDGLIATTTHSVLGTRWVYDATTDPVYATALAVTIHTGGVQADLWVSTDDGLHQREPTTRVAGTGHATTPPTLASITATTSGTTTVITAGKTTLVVHHVIDPHTTPDLSEPLLLGTWPGHDTPAVLAHTRPTWPHLPAPGPRRGTRTVDDRQ